MAYLDFTGAGITALAAAVPRTVIDNYRYTEHFPAADVREIVDKIGVRERRFADRSTTASDLCFAAAERLLADNRVDREEIDLLIFISQTPDYRMPATSVLLQDRLGLPPSTLAFDINLGCSAFLYGMAVAYSLMLASGLRRGLVLDGETRSKVYSPKDRTTAFLFGDAGAAALVERDAKFGASHFSLHSDGSRGDLIRIDAGGYRRPSSAETVRERVVDGHGNIRSEEQGYMHGADVFTFVNREVPRDIRALLARTRHGLDRFDYIVLHQANSFINGHVARRLGLDPEKVPSTIGKYGNTSSVSLPLTIVSELRGRMDGHRLLLMSAFGVGMTWGSAIVPFVDCRISEMVEV
jgi:3-oxoacyl-[acyl-carrier-protein] synthase-3